MADNYLERRMEAYRAQPAVQPRRAATLDRLLTKNRSVRAYDAHFAVRADQLRRIVGVCAKIPSAHNRQVLRFRPVMADEAPKVLPHIRMGGALPEVPLPPEGAEPNAFIVVCSTVPEDRWVDIDLGIAVQSMLLQAVEIGLNGLCIDAFDRAAVAEALRLPCEPLLVVAVGKSVERIEMVEIGAGGDRRDYRSGGVRHVPKVRAEELIIDADFGKIDDKS